MPSIPSKDIVNIRVAKKDGEFFLLSRKTCQDKTLSYEALGMLAYLMSHTDDWRPIVSDLQREKSCGRDRVYRIMNELIEKGFMTRTITRNEKGHIAQIDYVVYEEPLTEKPYTDKPDTAKPDTENTDNYLKKNVLEKEGTRKRVNKRNSSNADTTKKELPSAKEKNLSPVGEAVASEITQPLEAKNQPEADNTPEVKTPSKANDYQLMIRAIMYMLASPDSRRHIDYSNVSAQGLAKAVEPQLTGRAKKKERAEYKLETPMTPVEVIDFAKWYENQARLLEWKQLHPPMTASTLHDRVLEYRQSPRYPEHLERAQGILDKLAVIGIAQPEATISPVPSVEAEEPKYVPAQAIDDLFAGLKAKMSS